MKKIFLALVLLLAPVVWGGNYPQPTGWINDYANVLSDEFESKENIRLQEFTDRTTNEVTVLTIPTTEDESIEEYGIHLADEWKPGVKGKDNGVILIFAMNDRKMRIEVGRGVEDKLTDIEAGHIIETIKEHFKESDYSAGVSAGIDEVIVELDGKQSEVALLPESETNQGSSETPGWLWLIFGFIVIGIPIISIVLSEDGGSSSDGFFGGSSISFGGFSDSNDSFFSSSGGSSSSSSSGFGGFSGGSFSGGGASGSW